MDRQSSLSNYTFTLPQEMMEKLKDFVKKDNFPSINFFVSERIKYMNNKQIPANRFFWRTYEKKEIDLIEEREGKLFAYECKYSKKAVSVPKDFILSYPESRFYVVTRDSYLDFLT